MRRANLIKSIDVQHVRDLGKFVLMALVTTATVPIGQMYIRGYIINNLSLTGAGIWESVSRISTIYLMFVTTTLTTYYLPKLSELKSGGDLRQEIGKVYKIVAPIAIIASILIYFFRYLIIRILFTKDFSSAADLFLGQCVGDVFKVISWLLAFQMVAKAMTVYYIVTEVIFTLSYILLSVVLINYLGLVGVTYAYAINYFLYFIVMLWIFRDLVFNKKSSEQI
ncbi:hypothetical protein MKQ70_25140 [Chitinophaga sedimenti]|uniref:hypothetical protein n=1 Tax=Chitinophaga sedimenti TaxID=2033606 RepID=UPI002004E274|nr:hypothetical protein [Chitinophaga sedimenti]MCK7558112.1 hypothetical protein [Chitinophaga sedimenti]